MNLVIQRAINTFNAGYIISFHLVEPQQALHIFLPASIPVLIYLSIPKSLPFEESMAILIPFFRSFKAFIGGDRGRGA